MNRYWKIKFHSQKNSKIKIGKIKKVLGDWHLAMANGDLFRQCDHQARHKNLVMNFVIRYQIYVVFNLVTLLEYWWVVKRVYQFLVVTVRLSFRFLPVSRLSFDWSDSCLIRCSAALWSFLIFGCEIVGIFNYTFILIGMCLRILIGSKNGGEKISVWWKWRHFLLLHSIIFSITTCAWYLLLVAEEETKR